MKKRILRSLATFLNHHPGLKYLAVLLRDRAEGIQYKRQYADCCKTDPKLVVFESFWGRQYSDSPRALYEEMIKNPEYRSFHKVWVFRDPEEFAFLRSCPNTKLVKYGTPLHYKVCARAGIWVSNVRVPSGLCKKEDQIYIQTWHGTPLKRLGYDIDQYAGNKYAQKLHEHDYSLDAKRYSYMPAPSAFYKEKITSAFHLKELGKEDIFIDCCYPRNDLLFQVTEEQLSSIKAKLGIPKGSRVILYAPTWRETGHDAPESYQFRLEAHFDRWRQALGENTVILFRSHYMISSSMDLSAFSGFVYDMTNYEDIRELYLASDLLITDYSSVFFDFANLWKPMLFYMYDYEEYKYELRGFYIDEEELPGPIIRTEEELLELLPTYRGEAYRDIYKAFNDKYNPYRDGKGSETVWKTVLKE